MSFTDWNLGKPAAHGQQEYSFVMATTVDDLSYTPSEEEKYRDAAQFVATGRKSWKTLKGKGEAVWPPLLEAALLEALEKYSPDTGNAKADKTMGRFPMRNRFISDYIFETTGKRRTPKQVGSRLQQLRDTCKKEHILALISHRHTPEHSSVDSHSSYGASPSPRPESRQPTASTSFVHVQIGLQGELWPSPTPAIHLVGNNSTSPQIIQLSPASQRPSYYNDTPFPNILPFLSSSVEFTSQCALEPESTFLVYANGRQTPIHMEKVSLICVSSPIQRSGWLYRTSLVAEFWATLCTSQDLSQFAIIQQLKPTNAGSISSSSSLDRSNTSYQVISILYKFDARVNASRRSSLVNSLTYQSATPTTQAHSISSDISHSGLPGVSVPYAWQFNDIGDNLNNDCLQPLTGRSRHIDPNMHYLGPTATSLATSYSPYQQQSCVVHGPHLKEGQEVWGRSSIHAPVPLQHPHQLDSFYYS